MKRNFKRFLSENRWLKGVPNTLTVCNSLCGFAAILNVLQVYRVPASEVDGVMALSAYLVLGAMVFDALDGFTARIFNAASVKGLQMDSLSDMVTFGVAPAVMVAALAHLNAGTNLTRYGYQMAWVLCAIYLAGAAHRLARYNVHAMLEKKDSDKFTGLPSPGAAAAVVSVTLLFDRYDNARDLVRLLPLYTGLLGLLMVSDIHYNHMGKWLTTVQRNRGRMFLFLLFIAFFVYTPVLTAVFVINFYVVQGIVKDFARRYREHRSQHENACSRRA